MDGTQLKEHLVGFTERMHGFLAKDLNAVTEEDSGACPGGCARPARQFVAECASLNGMIADLLAGGEMKRRSPEEQKAHLDSFDTREKAIAYLNEQTARLVAAIQGMDENKLGETTDVLFGRPSTWFSVAEFPAIHMMYHDGQLNYLHRLNGDDKIHWW
jgi:hypothetical protein